MKIDNPFTFEALSCEEKQTLLQRLCDLERRAKYLSTIIPDLSGLTATPADVAVGVKFIGAAKTGETGTAIIANLTTKNATMNGTYTPASPYNGFSEFTVDVAQTGTDVSDTTLTAPNARAGYYFYLADGTKTAGTMADYTGLSVAGTMGYVTGSNYAISIDSSGYYASASSAVYISQSEIAADVGLTAAKLASGNTVLGVTGTAVVANLTAQTITSNGTYTPASPYNGFSSVTVSVSGGGGTDFPNPPTAGDCPVAIAGSGGVASTSSTTVLTSLTISVAGTYRFKFWGQTNSGTTTAYLNKNGTEVTYWSTVYGGGTLYTYDLACAANDVITVTGSRPGSGNVMFCSPLTACIAWADFPY